MDPSVFRWSALGADPNAPAVLRRRSELLRAAHRPPVASRVAHLRDLAEGRDVLDVGVVEHELGSRRAERWLHRHLCEVAGRCVGVDVLADEVAALRAEGYDVRHHDLGTGPLDETFDLIVAGDVVEHLDAPVAVLCSARAMLRPGGRLVVTTPNPYMLHRVWHHLRGQHPDSADHALLLGPSQVLELAGRAGLALDAWRGVRLRDLPGLRNRVASGVRRALATTVLTPESACDTLVYELVPGDLA